MSTTIALIGCGKMGRALLDGWIDSKIKASYIVVEPNGLKKKPKNVTVLKKPDAKLKSCDIIVMAVKPQVMNDTAKSLKPFVKKNALILSIAAGRSIKSFEKSFGAKQPVVRSMPNLPAAIGEGMIVAVANKNVSPSQKNHAFKLLNCVGVTQWVNDEKLMDAVTAVSGSGPAYVFLLIETLAKAAESAGLNKGLSMTLARQTVIGSAILAAVSDEDTSTLRKNVTSPGGTTEAALKILMNGDMQKIFDRAILAAKKRGKELSS